MSLWSEFLTNQGRQTRKWTHYFPIYERHLCRFVNRTTTLIEIGVSKGGSLQLWKRYLGPFTRIVGIDVNPACKLVEEGQISVRIGNQNDVSFLQKVIDEFGPPDIIIDDGSHKMKDLSASFEFLYPRMDKNGVYLVENLHTSYWEEYGGGFKRAGSFIEKCKSYIDELNADHSRGAVPISTFSKTTHSVHFYDSVAVFERGTHIKKSEAIIGQPADSSQTERHLSRSDSSQRHAAGPLHHQRLALFKQHSNSETHGNDIGGPPSGANAKSGVEQAIEMLHCHSDRPLAETFNGLKNSIAVYDGAPDAVAELEGAFFVPGWNCIYDSAGVRVAQSCVYRGPGLHDVVDSGPEIIRIPDDYSTIHEPVLFLSLMSPHWGHFLTEGTSRLWARLRYPELSKIAGLYSSVPVGKKERYSEFLEPFDLSFEKNVINPHRAVKLTKCFVPKASMSIRNECYMVHRDVFHTVSRHCAPAGKSRAADTAQLVFLSRTKVKTRRQIRNEETVEALMRDDGAAIVYPEQLTLKEQVLLFNTHRAFVGCWGTAFHNILFSLETELQETHVLCDLFPHLNLVMLDAIAGHQAHYVDCVSPTPESKPVWPEIDETIDVDKFTAYWRARPRRGAGS